MSKCLNEHRISFIICSNDDLYASECELYIRSLNVPEGYDVDVLIVKDARSMTSGYNEAMAASDAKYKIYLHQDVLIRFKNFLYEVIELFLSDSSIGMIGMVGNTVVPSSGIMWEGDPETRIGGIYGDFISSSNDGLLNQVNGRCQDVVMIDGLLMATQYDVRWREDMFDGWHFYDGSQSMEFQREGYRVVIPHMDKPWCFHDNDVQYLGEDYQKYRQLFLNEYVV